VYLGSANSVVSKSFSPSEHQLTSTPAVNRRRQVEKNIINSEPDECTSRKVEYSSDKTSQVIGLSQSIEHLPKCNGKLDSSPRKRVAFLITTSSDRVAKRASSVISGNTEHHDTGINLFKKPATIPILTKKTAEVMHSPNSVIVKENNASFVQQPQFSGPFVHSLSRVVPLSDLSGRSQLKRQVISNDTLTNADVPGNSKYLCSPQEAATSCSDSAIKHGHLQFNGVASINKVQSWLVSTSKYFPPNDVEIGRAHV